LRRKEHAGPLVRKIGKRAFLSLTVDRGLHGLPVHRDARAAPIARVPNAPGIQPEYPGDNFVHVRRYTQLALAASVTGKILMLVLIELCAKCLAHVVDGALDQHAALLYAAVDHS